MKAAQRRLSALGLREAMPGIFGPVRQNKSRRPPGRLAPKDFDIGLPNHAGCPPTDWLERVDGSCESDSVFNQSACRGIGGFDLKRDHLDHI